jgi:hypothetical protein
VTSSCSAGSIYSPFSSEQSVKHKVTANRRGKEGRKERVGKEGEGGRERER